MRGIEKVTAWFNLWITASSKSPNYDDYLLDSPESATLSWFVWTYYVPLGGMRRCVNRCSLSVFSLILSTFLSKTPRKYFSPYEPVHEPVLSIKGNPWVYHPTPSRTRQIRGGEPLAGECYFSRLIWRILRWFSVFKNGCFRENAPQARNFLRI